MPLFELDIERAKKDGRNHARVIQQWLSTQVRTRKA
jgi:hypothetical protein